MVVVTLGLICFWVGSCQRLAGFVTYCKQENVTTDYAMNIAEYRILKFQILHTIAKEKCQKFAKINLKGE